MAMRCDGMSSPFFPPNFLLQLQTHQTTEQLLQTPQSLSPLLPPAPCSNDLPAISNHDERESLNRSSSGAAALTRRRSTEAAKGEEEAEDEFSAGGERKRRLNVNQVRTLERNFEMGNRLEPERKEQLARALGLQPRQIAIWFQNRRARWKTKQLEKDYDALKRQIDAIREENRSLETQNRKLEAEILAMRVGSEEAAEAAINLNKETEASSSNSSGEKLAGGENESFANVFCAIDEHSAFWPWPDNPTFH